MEIIFIVWIGLSAFVGYLAHTRSRDPTGWGLLALIISPLVAGICLFVLPEGGSRKCPSCAESIKAEAKACKHCGRNVEPVGPPPYRPPQTKRALLFLAVVFIILLANAVFQVVHHL
jgi:hypothetical protein